MSPQYMVNLAKLRHDADKFARGWSDFERMLANMNKRFRDVRNNERVLVSRNKREGWYMTRLKTLGAKGSSRLHFRTNSKAWALRYRKQTGAQIVRVKEKK